jgi:hypothetical protein
MEPCSSHPEAEVGVEIFSPATRSAVRRNHPPPPQKSRKAIMSIDGRDVEEVPVTRGRVA